MLRDGVEGFTECTGMRRMAEDEMTDEERLKQWNGWLDKITAEVSGLIISRHVYTRVQEIIAANPAIQQSCSFYDCYATEHATYAAMAIRRSLDRDRNAVSLARLRESISMFPHILSRERYVAAFKSEGYCAKFGENSFDQAVGERRGARGSVGSHGGTGGTGAAGE